MTQEKDTYTVEDIPTQTEPMIYDGKNGITIQAAIAKILNNQEKILNLIK